MNHAFQSIPRDERVVISDDVSLNFLGCLTKSHNKIYQDVCSGGGFEAEDNHAGIATAVIIYNSRVSPAEDLRHPCLNSA